MKLTRSELKVLASMFSEDGRELRLILPMLDATDQMLHAMQQQDDLKQQAQELAEAMTAHDDAGGDHGDAGGDHGDAGGGAGGDEKLEISSRHDDKIVLGLRQLLARRAALIDRSRKLELQRAKRSRNKK